MGLGTASSPDHEEHNNTRSVSNKMSPVITPEQGIDNKLIDSHANKRASLISVRYTGNRSSKNKSAVNATNRKILQECPAD